MAEIIDNKFCVFLVTNPPQRRIGSVSDMDPVNDVYGSLSNEYRGGNANHQIQNNQYNSNNHQTQNHPSQIQNANNTTGVNINF